NAERERALVERLWQGLVSRIPEIRRNGHPERRVPGILNLCVAGVEGEAILGYLDMHGIMASSGSACTSGSLDPSHVLLAIGLPAEVAHGSVRFSLSAETTAAEIDFVIATMPQAVARLRQMSPTWRG
ncbi:MAG: aminotransferase class V-fold PLP-dependent enzyme, partial [Planctomycetota bacterium]|nr:aminotransferase class V-fold PLP-dependent enzyme [Planctomycetota bacterium]